MKKPAAPEQAEAKTDNARKEEDGSRLGTSLSGVIGAGITLALAFLAGFVLKKRNRSA
jgi:hypothetical protein